VSGRLRGRRAALGRVALAVAAAAGLLAGCQKAARPAFQGIDITGAEYAQRLDLPDPGGQRRSLEEFRGRVVVVFFGFAQCPDVCPTTMLELADIRAQLGADGQRVQGIFVTIDPERDTPEVLQAYVTQFDPGFIALRGTLEETAETARHFKVFYRKVPSRAGDGSYTMDHTAGSYVFDAQGRIRLFTRHGAGPAALLHDLRLLLAEG
jgi:protein SCO1/2